MYVAVSQFTVMQDCADEVIEAFQHRPHEVDRVSGFIRMEVLSPTDNPSEFWLITFWDDESSFTSWHRSHAFKTSHQAIPHGLKLVPERTRLRSFRLVCE